MVLRDGFRSATSTQFRAFGPRGGASPSPATKTRRTDTCTSRVNTQIASLAGAAGVGFGALADLSETILLTSPNSTVQVSHAASILCSDTFTSALLWPRLCACSKNAPRQLTRMEIRKITPPIKCSRCVGGKKSLSQVSTAFSFNKAREA